MSNWLANISGRISRGADTFRTYAEDTYGDANRIQQQAYNMENAGANNWLDRTRNASAMMLQGNLQFDQQRDAMFNACNAAGWRTPQCQEIARANNLQVPPLMQTGSYDIDVQDYNISSPLSGFLGLRGG